MTPRFTSPSLNFARELIAWYQVHRRSLPWRETDNPYFIWISEAILQQTRVAQGLDYYLTFTRTFPSVQDLADAPIDAVMKVWQGLGYYMRARNLHKAAKIIMEKHNGQIPSTYEELLQLPGLGPYAAGAVASFAFHQPVPAIDGNVYRILARIFGIFESPGKATGKKIFRELCTEMMDRSQPHIYNQALIDFGALQCIPTMPNCAQCPFPSLCYAEANNLQLQLPTKERTLKLRTRFFHFFMIRFRNSTYIERREGKDIWNSLYQFPLVEVSQRMSIDDVMRQQEVVDMIGHDYSLIQSSDEIRQLLSHQELFIRFHIVQLQSARYELNSNYQRVPVSDIFNYQVPISIHNYLVAEEAAPYFVTAKDNHDETDQNISK